MSTDLSTFALAKAAYTANAGWFEDQSVTKAAAFATACTALLLLLPNSSLKGSNSVGYSKGELQKQLEAARVFVQANRSGAGSMVRADLRRFRQ